MATSMQIQNTALCRWMPIPKSIRMMRTPFSAWYSTAATSTESRKTRNGLSKNSKKLSSCSAPPTRPCEMTQMCTNR